MKEINEMPSYIVPSFARSLTVLLVDNDTTSLMLLASMLEQYSYKVTTTESAIVALSMVREHESRFKLVIANIKTPDMDSITFQFTVLKRNIPLVFMSCNPKLGTALRALADGVCFYYEKPISLDEAKYVWQHAFRKKPTPFKLKTIQADAANYREKEVNSWGRTEAQGIKLREPVVVPGGSNDLPGTNLPQQKIIIDPKGKQKLNEPREVFAIDDDSSEEFSKTAWIESLMHPSESQKTTGSSGTKRSNDDPDQSEGKGKKVLKMSSQNSNSAGNKRSAEKDSSSSSTSKRSRMVWDHEMRLKFTEAIRALGDKNARPSAILKIMNVPGLTHRQVSNHLQTYKTQVKRISETKATSLPSAVMNKPSNILGGAGSSNILGGAGSSNIFGGAGSSAEMPGINNSILSHLLGSKSSNSLTAGINGAGTFQFKSAPCDLNIRGLSLNEKKTAPLASKMKHGSKKYTGQKPQVLKSSAGKSNSGKAINADNFEAMLRDWNKKVYATSSTSVAPPPSLAPPASLAPPPIWVPSTSFAPPSLWAPTVSLTPTSSESQNQPSTEYSDMMKLLDEETGESHGIYNESNHDEIDSFCEWLDSVLLGDEENP